MSLDRIATDVGAADVFVLRLVTPERLVNLDGHGRGAGWAGNVDVDPTVEPWIRRVLDEGLLRIRYGMPHRVFGPYWATETAGIRVGEYVVVLGGKDVAGRDEGELRSAAERAVTLVDEVPVAKRLADDLEVAQAALSIAKMRSSDLEEAARAIAQTAARATSCEFGAVLLYGPPLRLFLPEEGWSPSATEEEIISALLPIGAAVSGGLLVEQDMSASALPYPPLAFEDGIVARCAVPLGRDGSLGLLAVAHSAEAPRGFTMLCQRVMKTIGDTAEEVLGALVVDPT